MKRCFARGALVIGLVVIAVPAFSGARVIGVGHGFRGGMVGRLPASARIPGLPVQSGVGGQRFGGSAGRFEPGRLDRPPFGERWRRRRGLPVFSSTIGNGYPYDLGDDDELPAETTPDGDPTPHVAFVEHYFSGPSAAPIEPQFAPPPPQFDAGPRIIYIHPPRANRRQAPMPRVIYGTRPQPEYE